MQNSKLYSILESFNKYEQNRLRKFLVSPYFNKNEALLKLFDGLVNHINAETEGEISKKQLWKGIYAKNSYDDVLFRKNCSDLLKLIENFLAQQIYETNPIHQATYLIQAIGKRKLEKLFNSTMKTARRLSEQQPFRTSNYYLSQYQVEKYYFDLMELEHNRALKRNVEDILNNLDSFYLAEKLRYNCHVLSQQILVSHEYKLLFIDEIVSYLRRFDYEDVPPVAIYYQIYLTYVESENTEHYYNLKKLLSRYGDFFPRDEAEFIYQAALNYCMKKINQGFQGFMDEYFSLTIILLEKEFLFNDGELSPWHFRNIVGVALRLGKYDWAEEFINKYKSYLPELMRENAVTYSLATLFFYQKDYPKVIQLLQAVEYDDLTYNLNSKSILLHTYYEMDEIEPLYSLMDSFRTYLNRHKDFSTLKRTHYTNLIKFTKQLTKTLPGDTKAIEKLKKEVELAEPKGIASITWLKEKIAELEN